MSLTRDEVERGVARSVGRELLGFDFCDTCRADDGDAPLCERCDNNACLLLYAYETLAVSAQQLAWAAQVRDTARAQSNRDLEARRAAVAQLDQLRAEANARMELLVTKVEAFMEERDELRATVDAAYLRDPLDIVCAELRARAERAEEKVASIKARMLATFDEEQIVCPACGTEGWWTLRRRIETL